MRADCVENVLLVVGPSCAGKTTFIKALKGWSLPRQVAAELPADCAAWPLTDLDKVSPEHADPGGCIIHCDITCAYYPAMRELRPDGIWRSFLGDDQGFCTLLARAKRISVVALNPPRQQLLSQVCTRRALIHVPPFARRVARRWTQGISTLESWIPGWVPRVAEGLGPRARSRALARRQHARLQQVYESPMTPDEALRDWTDWLQGNFGDRVERILKVEPVPGCLGEFTLVESARTSLAGDQSWSHGTLSEASPAL